MTSSRENFSSRISLEQKIERNWAISRLAIALRRPTLKRLGHLLLHSVTGTLSILLLLLFAALPVLGQSNFVSLSGTVFDPQQQAIPGASVQLTSVSTQATRRVNSNDQGLFQITGLLPGEYKLAVEAAGFAVLNQSLRLEVGQQMTLMWVSNSLPLAPVWMLKLRRSICCAPLMQAWEKSLNQRPFATYR